MQSKSVNEYSELGQLYAGQHIKEIELAEKINKLIPSGEVKTAFLSGWF